MLEAEAALLSQKQLAVSLTKPPVRLFSWLSELAHVSVNFVGFIYYLEREIFHLSNKLVQQQNVFEG